jgi:hypothetical protein
MSATATIQDEPCVAPILDTWRNWDRAGSWLWSPRVPWSVDELALVLDVLRPIARVREALFGGPPDAPPLATPEHEWPEGVRHDVFERSLVEAARAAAVPITTIDIVLDLRVWVRTAPSPATPVLGWVRSAAEMSLYLDDQSPYGALMIHHTLFVDGNLSGEPNTELHRLNQPLLCDALAAIESRLGPITEVEGLPGVSRTGFASLDS